MQKTVCLLIAILLLISFNVIACDDESVDNTVTEAKATEATEANADDTTEGSDNNTSSNTEHKEESLDSHRPNDGYSKNY